jgi:hypothetical protein
VLDTKYEGKIAKAGLLKPVKYRKKKCNGCGNWFVPERPLQIGCNYKCALIIATANRARKEKREAFQQKRKEREFKKQTKKMKDDIRPLNGKDGWLQMVERECNKYIRELDYFLSCCSCERHHQGQYHAGHYRPKGNNPKIRFHPLNLHKQCAPCNTYWSANKNGDGGGRGYTVVIKERIGMDAFEWLDRDHGKADWTREECELLIDFFRKQHKLLVSNRIAGYYSNHRGKQS